MTVYIDIIFLENLFMNYIIIFATGIIVKSEIKIIRNFLASLIGSVYAVLTYMNILKFAASNMALKILLSVVMIYVAFDARTIKTFFKQLIIFYLTSFTFGGVAFALLYFVNPQKILVKSGVLIGTYPIKMILGGGIVGFIIIITAFKNVKGKISKKDMFCNAKIYINKKYVFVKAIIDTGNFLKEPITKMPVMVVEKEVLREIVPDIILENLTNIINGKEIEMGEYASKIRLIPFTSLGKQNGMLLGIKADKVLINNEEENILVKNIIIGMYDGILTKTGKYKGLIGLEVLEDKGGILEDEYIRNIKV